MGEGNGGTDRVNNVLWIVEQLLDEVRANNPDRRLLERFARDRDEGAFAELVRRHGPMVLGVCRRVLGNDADADDAFQATFLVLARKAASVGDPDQLSQWLHGVAYNASRKLRQGNARRAAREHAAAVPAEVPEPDPVLAGEWLAVLDEELTRLPTHYRAVVVLCDLEGRTRREAASELGWPEGTVAGRLARARERLADLLRARGYAPAVGVTLAAQVLPSATVAAVARAVAVHGIAGAVGAGISPRAELTARGVIQPMFAKKLQTVAAGLCVGLALLAAAGGIHSANAQPGLRRPDSFEKPRMPDRPKPAEDKVLSVIPLKKLDARPTADTLLELLPKSVTVAAARDENALLVYATARGTDDVRLVLRTLGEGTPTGRGLGSPPDERPEGGGATSAPLTPSERVQLTLHELSELKRDLTKWKGKALTGYVLDHPLARIGRAEDALGPVLLAGKVATGEGTAPRIPRVALAMDELAVLKQEMNAQKGKKLEGDVSARLLGRIDATEKLLDPALAAGAPGTGSPGPSGFRGGSGAARLQEREKAAMAAMAGTWELHKTVVDGKEQENAFEYRRWHFAGRAVRSEYKTRGGQEHTSDLTVTVNPTTDPPEMNVHDKGTLLLAIYRQDGDRLTIAILGRSEVERPRGFDPKDKRVPDVPLIVWELRRQSNGTPRGGSAPPGAIPEGGASAVKNVEHTGTLTGVVLTQSATDETWRVESAAVRVKDQVFQLDVSESLAARQELIRLYGGDPFRSTAVADPQVTVKGRLEHRLATTLKKGEREAALVPVIVVESLRVNTRPLGIPGGGPGGLPPGGMPGGGAPGATGAPPGAMPPGGGAGIGTPARPRTKEERERDQADEATVAELVKSLGGSVQRDERLPGKAVVRVHLYRGKVTDDDLKTLGAFKNLRELELMDTAVTDAGMRHVAGMANLQALNIQGTKVTDEGLKHLRPLNKLADLDLTHTAVADAGAKHLLNHPGLTHLYLWGTKVTDVGVKDLVKLTALEVLELGNPKVTDAGVKELVALKGLTQLGLRNTGVTDKGMKSLAPLVRLSRLDLHDTALTDAGLKDLAALPALSDLRIVGCKVSDGGVAAFQKAKPGCHVEAEMPRKE
jgi:RNA polymerase sigma factor (sigma-70 family)